MLTTANRIYVIGFRNSYFFGAYFQSELARIRPDVTMLPQPGQTLAESLSALDQNDLMVMIGLRRRVTITLKVLKLARASHTKALYITDHGYQPTGGNGSSWILQARVAGTSLFDSYAPVVSILNLLCTAVSERLGDAGRTRLKRIDATHAKLAEFSDT